MKFIINLLLIFMCLILTSCTAAQKITPALSPPGSDIITPTENEQIVDNREDTQLISDTLRISNNLMNKSFVFSNGNSIFFKNFYYYDYDGQLCKMNIDGTDIQILSEYFTYNIVVYSDYVYFLFSNLVEDSDLCRIPINGGETEFLVRDIYRIYGLKDGYLYYMASNSTDYNFSGDIYRINLQIEPLQEELFMCESVFDALITDDGILYLRPDNIDRGLGDGHLCFANEDGKEKIELGICATLMATNGKQVAFENKEGLFILDYGTFDNIKKIADRDEKKGFSAINIDERFVYYNDPLDEYKLYRFDIQTGEKMKLCDLSGREGRSSHAGISIVEGYLYYIQDDITIIGDGDYYDDGFYYSLIQLKLDGSEYRLIEGDIANTGLSAPIKNIVN